MLKGPTETPPSHISLSPQSYRHSMGFSNPCEGEDDLLSRMVWNNSADAVKSTPQVSPICLTSQVQELGALHHSPCTATVTGEHKGTQQSDGFKRKFMGKKAKRQ